MDSVLFWKSEAELRDADVARLRAQLDDERMRNADLTSKLDRERTLRIAAEVRAQNAENQLPRDATVRLVTELTARVKELEDEKESTTESEAVSLTSEAQTKTALCDALKIESDANWRRVIEAATDTTSSAERSTAEAARWAVRVKRLERRIADARFALDGKIDFEASERSVVLRRFSYVMAEKLRENEDKGAWWLDTVDRLFELLTDEVEELRVELFEKGTRVPLDVAREAADVANFAMFIADVAGGLTESDVA